MIPSVTRVFSVDRPMYTYLQAYERDDESGVTNLSQSAAEPAGEPLFAYVSFYRNQKIVVETSAIAIMSEPSTRLGVVPFHFKLQPGKLKPGLYQCQVSVLDPAEHRAAFWQGSVMLVP